MMIFFKSKDTWVIPTITQYGVGVICSTLLTCIGKGGEKQTL